VATSGIETEIKLALASAAAGRAALRRAGFRVSKRRVLERNTVFDTPAQTLRKASCLLRVRLAGRVASLTYKGRPDVSRFKRREELETGIADARTVTAVLERLGFEPAFRYEKYRTEYRQPAGGGVAALDETPIGVYLELEGSAGWIDRAARRLGFAESQYVTASYAALYFAWCGRRGAKPSHMVFGK
jgi:adenylate cyclase class 2